MSWIKLTDRWKAWTWGRDSDTKFSQAENILILDSFLKIISVRIILYQRTKGKSYFSWPFKLISVLLDLLPTKKVLKAACDAFLCLLSPHPGRGLLLGLVHWGRSPWPARVSPSVPAWLPFFQEPSLASAWVRRSVLPRQVPGLLGLLLRPQLSVGWINELGTEYYRVLFFLSVSLTRKKMWKSQWDLLNIGWMIFWTLRSLLWLEIELQGSYWNSFWEECGGTENLWDPGRVNRSEEGR